VVFPAPFSPKSPIISPGKQVKLRDSTAHRGEEENRLLIFSSKTEGESSLPVIFVKDAIPPNTTVKRGEEQAVYSYSSARLKNRGAADGRRVFGPLKLLFCKPYNSFTIIPARTTEAIVTVVKPATNILGRICFSKNSFSSSFSEIDSETSCEMI
jgi:hypothetical protein